jgi:hypothetical protein
MQTKADIIRTLSSAACSGITFKIHDIFIHGLEYARVAQKINSGSIQVVQQAAHATNYAEYLADHDTILVGPSFDADVIVHEATHAILDMRGPSTRSLYYNEAVAYVAQAMYLFMVKPSLTAGLSIAQAQRFVAQQSIACLFDSNNCAAATAEAAGVIAMTILGGHRPKDRDVAILKNSIPSNPRYHGKPRKVHFSGLHGSSHLGATKLNLIGARMLL